MGSGRPERALGAESLGCCVVCMRRQYSSLGENQVTLVTEGMNSVGTARKMRFMCAAGMRAPGHGGPWQRSLSDISLRLELRRPSSFSVVQSGTEGRGCFQGARVLPSENSLYS